MRTAFEKASCAAHTWRMQFYWRMWFAEHRHDEGIALGLVGADVNGRSGGKPS